MVRDRNGGAADAGHSVYLSSIGHAIGDRVAIEKVDDPLLHDVRDELRNEGIEYCRVDGGPPLQLACRAAACTLRGPGAAAVDAVVFCSDTSATATPSEDVWHFLRSAGLPDVPAVAVSGRGCGNLAAGVSVARGLLFTSEATAVLLVTTDRIHSGTRYMSNGRTVLSDGAAACLVTTRPPAPGFRVLGMCTTVRADLDRVRTPLQLARAMVGTVGQAVDGAFKRLGARPDRCRYLLTANLGVTSRTFLAMAAGMIPAQVYCPWVADMGHCFAADIPVNLDTLARDGGVDGGDLLLMLPTSARSWSAVVLERVT